MSDHWKETKKEFEIQSDGSEKLIRVTRESDFKVWKYERTKWLFYFQAASSLGIVVAIIAIGINIFLQNKQNHFQLRQQKDLYELGLYTKAIKCMTAIVNTSTPYEFRSPAFLGSTQEFLNEVYPSLVLSTDFELEVATTQFKFLLQDCIFFRQLEDSMERLHDILGMTLSERNDTKNKYASLTSDEMVRCGGLYAAFKEALSHWQLNNRIFKKNFRYVFGQKSDSVYSVVDSQMHEIVKKGMHAVVLGAKIRSGNDITTAEFLAFYQDFRQLLVRQSNLNVELSNSYRPKMTEIRSRTIRTMRKLNAVLQ